MSARAQILGAIRDSLGRDAPGRDEAAVDARLGRHDANLIPERARAGEAELAERFVQWAEHAAATVTRVAGAGDVPAAVAGYLAERNLPARVRRAPDPALDAIPWERAPLLALEPGVGRDEDAVALTGAFAGVAETGTLMINSGPDHPTTLNILPETHIVVLRRDQVVGGYEAAWDRLRAAGGGMPRTVMLVTGPSRSGDIEQTLQLGAHGPKRLHIVLIDGEAPQD